MDHQTASFWNGHKVTSHTEVGHSHWTTPLQSDAQILESHYHGYREHSQNEPHNG